MSEAKKELVSQILDAYHRTRSVSVTAESFIVERMGDRLDRLIEACTSKEPESSNEMRATSEMLATIETLATIEEKLVKHYREELDNPFCLWDRRDRVIELMVLSQARHSALNALRRAKGSKLAG